MKYHYFINLKLFFSDFMDKKFLTLIVIAAILIIAGGYLIFTSQSGGVSIESSDMDLKTHDFKLFTADVPKESDFTLKNEADGMKFYQNNGSDAESISGIIITKALTDDLIGDNSQLISNSSGEKIYAFEFKNQTVYRYVSMQDDADIILMGNDLHLLKEVSDTVKIKDVKSL